MDSFGFNGILFCILGKGNPITASAAKAKAKPQTGTATGEIAASSSQATVSETALNTPVPTDNQLQGGNQQIERTDGNLQTDRTNKQRNENQVGEDEIVQPTSQERSEAKQFRSMQRAIHRVVAFVGTEQFGTLSYDALNIRYERLLELWEKANGFYMTLISDVEEHMSESYEDCMEILEEEYYEACEVLRKRITDLTPSNANIEGAAANEGGVSTPATAQPIKLIMPVQQHNIPNTWGYFDGDLTQWLGFRDRFMKAFHEQADISDSWKHTHLLDSLKGQAKETLGKSGTVEGTYQQAWDRLCEIYNKPYSIARLQLREFFKLPYLSGPATAAELQKMSNITHETVRQLHALQFPVDAWDFVFIHCLHDRLDSETARQWNLARTSEYPTVKEMTKFLDREAGASTRTKPDIRQELKVTIDNRPKDKPMDSVRSSTPYGNRNTGATPKQFPCEACGGREYHKIHECPNYQSLNHNGRKEFIARRRLCPNCLKKWHPKDSCRDPRCPYAQCAEDNFHNSTICPFKPNGAYKRAAANPV